MEGDKVTGRIKLKPNAEPQISCVTQVKSGRRLFSIRHFRGPELFERGERYSLSLGFSIDGLQVELPLDNDGRGLIEDLGEAREWLLKMRREHD